MKSSSPALWMLLEDQPRPRAAPLPAGEIAMAQAPSRPSRPRTSLSFRTGRIRSQRLDLFRVY